MGKDEEAAEALRRGDEQVFRRLYRQHSGNMVALARTVLGDRGAAEEVVQDTWLAVFASIQSFEGRASLKSWIFSILVNKARTRAKRDRRMIPFTAFETEDHDEPAVDPSRFDSSGMWVAPPRDPERIVEGQRLVSALAAALDELPPAQRAVIILRDVEGHDVHETSRILEVSEGNQRVLLHRARSKLRAVLEAVDASPAANKKGAARGRAV